MTHIEIKDSSIDLYEDFLGDGYHIGLIYDLDELFKEYNNSLNYIQNKQNDTHQALWFGPLDYKYGKFKNLKATPLKDWLIELANIIEFECGYEKGFLNSVYINSYNNAGIGYHHDNDSIFKNSKEWNDGKDIIVAVYSIGGDSKISIAETQNGKEIANIIAKDNSLYIMNKNFQNTLYHKVGNSKGQRYSFTFRHCLV